MGSAIELRGDYNARVLRQLARHTRNANCARRLLALAAIYGATRGEAATLGSVRLQIVRDWFVRLNEKRRTVMLDGRFSDPPSKLKEPERRTLALRNEKGPIHAVDGVVRFRLVDLAQWVWEEFRISVSISHAQPGDRSETGRTSNCPTVDK